MKNKIVLQSRVKSVVMWCGIVASAFLAVGYDWHNLTSWGMVYETICNIVKNPAVLIALAINIYSTANNPTNKAGF